MKSFACTFYHCFTFPFCVYAGTLPAGGFVLVHRIHNTTDSGYSANVHADSPLCAVLLSCFFFYGDTTLKLMASSKLLWSLLAITMLSFLSCLLSVVVCHHFIIIIIITLLSFYILHHHVVAVVVVIIVIFLCIPCKFPRYLYPPDAYTVTRKLTQYFALTRGPVGIENRTLTTRKKDNKHVKN